MQQQQPGTAKYDIGGGWKARPKQNWGDVYKTSEIVVTAVEGPMVFYAQVVDREKTTEFLKLFEALQGFCEAAPPQNDTIKMGKIYAAKFSEDESWYRCKINQMNGNEVKVTYIDYGNNETKAKSDLVELPPNLQSPKPHADKYVLWGLVPATDYKSPAYKQGLKYMQDMIQDKTCTAQFVQISKTSQVTPVILEVNGIDVNQEMLSQGHGHRRNAKSESKDSSRTMSSNSANSSRGNIDSTPVWSSPPEQMPPAASNSRGGPVATEGSGPVWSKSIPPPGTWAESNINSFSSSIPNKNNYAGSYSNMPPGAVPQQTSQKQHHHPGPPTKQASLAQGPPTSRKQPSPLLGPPPLASHPQSSANVGGPGGGGGGDADYIYKLERELAHMGKELTKVKGQLKAQQEVHVKEYNGLSQDRDAAVINAATGKAKLKELESHVNKLTTKLSENGLSTKINYLVSGLKKVKSIRNQFPTHDDQSGGAILEAIGTLTGSDRLVLEDITVLNSVKSAIDAYSFIQERIKYAQQLSDVSELIPARHEARKELSARISEFTTVVEQLPLDARQKQLQQCIELISSTFLPFLKAMSSSSLSLQDAASLFMEWKKQKYADFQEVRTNTNTCHNALHGALSNLLQQLSLETESEETDKPVCNLDSLLKQFQCEISDEINKTDVLHQDDSSFITLVCTSVLQEAQQQLSDVDQLQTLATRYATLQADIQPWLSEKPDVSRVQAVRKTIRNLKSKLRHRLADKDDLDELESDDSSQSELSEILNDLTEIRSELQEAFEQEDNLLSELVEVNEKHFPELTLQYSELALGQEKSYCDKLIKLGRSLDQFDLKPLNNAAACTNVKKTTWCGKPIVLKEHIVNGGGDVKEAILNRISAYHHIASEYTVPIKSIFFVQNDRQAFLHMPYYERNLTTLVADNRPDDEAILKIGRCVLHSLQTLHDAAIVHGAIHPNNVFMTDDGDSAVLAEFDFTKSTAQRCSHRYTTASGLPFAAPEPAELTTTATDMYCFGLLLYWLHAPNAESISLTDDPCIAQNMGLKQLLMYLLDPDWTKRCTAHDAALYPYFATVTRSSSPTEGDTIQLKPKQNISPKVPNAGGGILKNSISSLPVAPPVCREQTAHDDDEENGNEEEEMNKSEDKDDEPLNGEKANEGGDDDDERINDDDEEDHVMESENKDEDEEETTADENLTNGYERSVYSPDPKSLAQDVLISKDTPLPCTPMGTPVNTPVTLNDEVEPDTAVKRPVCKLVTEAAMLVSAIPSPNDPREDEAAASDEEEDADMDKKKRTNKKNKKKNKKKT